MTAVFAKSKFTKRVLHLQPLTGCMYFILKTLRNNVKKSLKCARHPFQCKLIATDHSNVKHVKLKGKKESIIY